MGFLDKAKRDKAEDIRMQKALQSRRKSIHAKSTLMVQKLLQELGIETWGNPLFGKCHFRSVVLDKTNKYEAGPWGWYVGKGKRGKRSQPYGLGTSNPGECEAYGVMISLQGDSMDQPRFAVIYGILGQPESHFTSDLSQAALEEALVQAFKSGPFDLGHFEDGIESTLRMLLLGAETVELADKLEALAEEWQEQVEEGSATLDQVPQSLQNTICPGCGTLLSSTTAYCSNCKTPLAEPTVLNQIYDLLLEGRKIAAIKLYRKVYDLGLRDAKNLIDTFAESIEQR